MTERVDRGVKLRLYRTMRSVEAVAIGSHRRPSVEVHRRSGAVWTVTEATSGAIAVAGFNVDLDVLYRDL